MAYSINYGTTITVLRNHTVCLSVGPTRGKVSSISLVIEYTCTGSSNCPLGGASLHPVTEQFDFGCVNSQGSWGYAQFKMFNLARLQFPAANFETSLRTDCGACFPVHPDTVIPQP